MGGGSKGGGGGSQTVGYRYFLGVHMGLGRGPIDELVQINVEEKVAWKGSLTDDGTIQINKPTLFGGDDKEGGIVGPFILQMGKATQTATTTLAAMLRNNVPGFRGLVAGFFDGQVCSNNPYPKPWKFRVRRARKGWVNDTPWYPEKAVIFMTDSEDASEIIHGMNPAHIIYECLTNPEWGRGLPTSMLDEDSFTAAANALSVEGFGLCLRWTRTGPLSDFIGSVINHVAGTLYLDRQTGLITFRLLRNDYDPDDLPLFNYQSGLLQIEEDDSGAQDNTANEIIVKFHQVSKNKERQVRAQNLASRQASGSVLPMTIDMPGIPTHTLATRVAQRELRVRTVALKRYKLKMDRRGFGLAPGGLFKMQDTSRGITSIILRVAKVEEPPPTENYISVWAVQDVFGLPATTFNQPQPEFWEPAASDPKTTADVVVREIPYRDLVMYLAESDLATVADDAAAVQMAMRSPSAESQDFEIWSKAEGEDLYYRRAIGSFVPYAETAGAVGPYETEIAFGLQEYIADQVLPSGAVMGGESIKITAVDYITGTLTVDRGCGDTVPKSHAAGTKIYLLDGYTVVDRRQYVEGDVVHVRLLPRTLSATYPFDTAADYPLTLAARHFRPYPPANLKVNGTLVGDADPISGMDADFTWAERNRLTQGDNLIGHTAATVTPEVGTTYNIRVYSGLRLLRESTAVTGTTWSYTQADWDADGRVRAVRFELEAERDSVVSWTRYDFVLVFEDPVGPLAVGRSPSTLGPRRRRTIFKR